MNWFWLIMIAPGLLCGYVLVLRPILHAIPALKNFYAEADGFWAKVWAICGKSVTIAFSAFVQAIGWALQWIDPIASMLGDPDLKAQITSALQANPQLLGYVLIGISAITIAARLRSIAKAA